LGPILFLIYNNDLPQITNSKTILYVDDTALFSSHSNAFTLETIVNTKLEKVIRNKLTLNIKKFMPHCVSKKDVKLKLEIDKNQFNLKNDTKYLGLYIDKHLIWESHIEKLQSSLARSSGILYNIIKKYVSRDTLRMVYYALGKSKLQYGIVLWGNAKKKRHKAIADNKPKNQTFHYTRRITPKSVKLFVT